jgi:SAM-dependent methyltransferase
MLCFTIHKGMKIIDLHIFDMRGTMIQKVDDNFKKSLSWEEKAQKNPLFAVMSAEQFAEKGADPEKWTEEDLNRFFDKGRRLYEVFLCPLLQRIPLEAGHALIVEYGSGMGRILKAMYAEGYDCAGIDISPTMLDLSRRLVPEVEKLHLLTEKGTTSLPDRCADFVFSYAVLQHINRLSRVRLAFDEMCRLLKPGGILKVQFRTVDAPYRRNVLKRRSILNFEMLSVTLGWNGYFSGIAGLSGILLPSFSVLRHTNWVGVPLSIRALERDLARRGVRILGIEEEPSHENMFWLTGRKQGTERGR